MRDLNCLFVDVEAGRHRYRVGEVGTGGKHEQSDGARVVVKLKA